MKSSKTNDFQSVSMTSHIYCTYFNSFWSTVTNPILKILTTISNLLSSSLIPSTIVMVWPILTIPDTSLDQGPFPVNKQNKNDVNKQLTEKFHAFSRENKLLYFFHTHIYLFELASSIANCHPKSWLSQRLTCWPRKIIEKHNIILENILLAWKLYEIYCFLFV